MTMFTEDHHAVFGVGPICSVLPIAPATYYARAAIMRDPELASDRTMSDAIDCEDIKRVYKASGQRYGARKVWHALRREGKDIARCTLERQIKGTEIQGVVRGGKVITTNPDAVQPCLGDKVNHEFVAQTPNQLWVSGFTYVSSWSGMVYMAFVIDVFACKIVSWRVSTLMTTSFVLDALNQAICQLWPSKLDKLVHKPDCGSQYLTIKYTERLSEPRMGPSVGNVGEPYDNAQAESTIGLFKTEVINVFGPCKTGGRVEWETLKLVNWYNTERLHSVIGYVTPQKEEETFYANMNNFDEVAEVLNKTRSRKTGTGHFWIYRGHLGGLDGGAMAADLPSTFDLLKRELLRLRVIGRAARLAVLLSISESQYLNRAAPWACAQAHI